MSGKFLMRIAAAQARKTLTGTPGTALVASGPAELEKRLAAEMRRRGRIVSDNRIRAD